MNNLIYNISDKPRTIKEWILYPIQMLLSVFVATVLISTICGTPVSSCLLGAGIATIVYELITSFKSPMFISSSGATVAAVVGAMALPGISNSNYTMVAIGGVIIAIVYISFALVVKFMGIKILNKIFPATIVGSITMVIGLNLMGFITGYLGTSGNLGLLIAIITAVVVALSSHYFKGFLKTIPFLLGLIVGYILSLCFGMIDFTPFTSMNWYPDVTFLKWNSNDISWANVLSVICLFIPVSLCALLEHYSDHMCLSNIIGTDLTNEPGLDKTLIGDGVASCLGTIVCGLPNTSYGESVATIGFSRVASVWVSFVTACILILMSFIGPISAFITTVPSFVFAGCAMILYGYIASSGLKTLMRNKVDLENQKNLIVVSVILSIGVSGVAFTGVLGDNAFSIAGVALAMIIGVILNLILKDKKENN